jgi:uncharacterized protein (DUF1499 family)
MFPAKLQKRPELGVKRDRFTLLSAKPNGVSSQSEADRFRVEPVQCKSEGEKDWRLMVELASAMEGVTLVKEEETYAHFECRSRFWGFIDDLELFFNRKRNQIEFRSAARVGYSDLGVNRKRVERLQAAYFANQASADGS